METRSSIVRRKKRVRTLEFLEMMGEFRGDASPASPADGSRYLATTRRRQTTSRGLEVRSDQGRWDLLSDWALRCPGLFSLQVPLVLGQACLMQR